MTTKSTARSKVVPQDAWLAARSELLAKEKEFTHLRDQLSAERRALPWVNWVRRHDDYGDDGKER